MKLKRTLSLLLAIVLTAALILPGSASAASNSMSNFDPYTADYTYGQFSDVNESAWYGYENQRAVATACGLGLMNGTGSGFAPDGSLTIAQTVTMAARLFSTYTGDNHKFVQGNPWYQCYVDYAVENGILYENEFADSMTRTATRAEMAYLLYYSLPDAEMKAINSVTSLPDVKSDNPYYDHIVFLYDAGILTGNDAYGTFTPDAPITRAAAAAIVSRLALPELRKTFTLSPATTTPPTNPSTSDPATLLDYSHYQSVKKPAYINTYNDFVAAWEWMLVNTVFEASFSSQISCSAGDIETLQSAALEAFNLAATFNYFDYASFRRSISINTYYVSGSSGNCQDITFKLSLANADGISNSTIKTQVSEFESTCAAIVTNLYKSGELKTSMTNKEKAYVLYRYVVLNNAYDESYKRYTGYDAAVIHSSVCQGYAGMYSYLCNLAGVPMRGMTGQANGGPHAWNRIYENGQWYYIDTTFADPTPNQPGYCDDSWFWLTESELRYGSSPHTIDTDNIVYAGVFSVSTEKVSALGSGELCCAYAEYAA